jgi:hypothetical protein
MSVTAFPWSTVADVERRHILETLLHCDGNRTCAAKVLGISIRGLRTKLGKYQQEGFNVPRPGAFPGAARMPSHLIPQPTSYRAGRKFLRLRRVTSPSPPKTQAP